MRVRLLSDCAEGELGTVPGVSALRRDVEYVVLELYCDHDGPNYFRIEHARDQIPGLFDARVFEVIDSSVHSSWELSLRSGGSLLIAPALWHRVGFWEEYLDGAAEAIRAYNLARASLMGECWNEGL